MENGSALFQRCYDERNSLYGAVLYRIVLLLLQLIIRICNKWFPEWVYLLFYFYTRQEFQP